MISLYFVLCGGENWVRPHNKRDLFLRGQVFLLLIYISLQRWRSAKDFICVRLVDLRCGRKWIAPLQILSIDIRRGGPWPSRAVVDGPFVRAGQAPPLRCFTDRRFVGEGLPALRCPPLLVPRPLENISGGGGGALFFNGGSGVEKNRRFQKQGGEYYVDKERLFSTGEKSPRRGWILSPKCRKPLETLGFTGVENSVETVDNSL